MKVDGGRTSKRERVFKDGPMEITMRASGLMVPSKVKVC